MRRQPDGSDLPYDINITWFDAMKGTERGEPHWQEIMTGMRWRTADVLPPYGVLWLCLEPVY